jgi:hypothetical protein
MKSSSPFAAPKARSPRAATLVSRSRNAGRPRAAPSSGASGMSRKLGPRLGGSMTWPVRGSSGPGDETPMPTIASATSRRTSSRAVRAAWMQASTTAAGPCSFGVSRSTRARRLPSGRTTAARIWVPPRSTAMTGWESRAKPRARGQLAPRFYRRTPSGPREPNVTKRPPPDAPTGVRAHQMRSG